MKTYAFISIISPSITSPRTLEHGVLSVTEEQIVGVTIHGMDCALVDLLVRHPVVKLYIVDMSTGEYFNKSDPSRAVCYFSENTGYIQPIMSHPYDFRKHR